MKMLKTKHFRRLAVFLAMIAPAVYLFGSLFSALTGAHGTEVFAEPIYTEQYVQVDGFSNDGDYKISFDVVSYLASEPSSFNLDFDFELNGREFKNLKCFYHSDNRYYVQARNDSLGFAYFYSYRPSDGDYRYDLASPWIVFSGVEFSYLPISSDYLTIFKLVYVPSAEVPENAGAYSDYVFKNFFAKDNFLVQWGENAISENPHGFAPFGAFWRYLDANMLHLSGQQIGLMGYGYLYYACHVLLFDVGFVLVTFFLDFIQRIADKFTGGE